MENIGQLTQQEPWSRPPCPAIIFNYIFQLMISFQTLSPAQQHSSLITSTFLISTATTVCFAKRAPKKSFQLYPAFKTANNSQHHVALETEDQAHLLARYFSYKCLCLRFISPAVGCLKAKCMTVWRAFMFGLCS